MVWGLLLLLALDMVVLYQKKEGITGHRVLPEKFSNSDPNPVSIRVRNAYNFSIGIAVIDEIPMQFQKRDFDKQAVLAPHASFDFEYLLYPKKRGEYTFGNLHIYANSPFQMLKRRYSFDRAAMVKVYPSFIQMKKYDFLAITNKLTGHGFKKMRRIGHTLEFEQIKEYVRGDDARTINWKSTAKHGKLMANQYQDEKSQPIYSLIDTSRVMKMPFNGLSLLDYAVNSTLAFSNIALKKHDKVGMLAFSNTITNYLPASGKKTYIRTISEALYTIKTRFLDADYGLLYGTIKQKVTQRSLLLLYTNFEHHSALKRQLPYLKSLSKQHLLIVIFFKNTTLDTFVQKPSKNLETLYDQTIASEFIWDKKKMINELHRHGIQAILTAPENLTVNTINKYLEIKARGLL